jgi:nucleotide-binding universal stress UspA family protein
MSDNPETRSIVVGYDGSPQARDALAVGTALARATGDRIVLARAYGPRFLMSQAELDERERAIGEQLGRVAEGIASDESPAVECIAVPGSSAAGALHELAEVERPRALVLGSCHRGVAGRVLMGSVAERLLHGSPCPVVVAPRWAAEGEAPALGTVCVAFDGGAEGWAALQRGAQIAAAGGAHLRVVMVIPPLAGTPTMPVLPQGVVVQRDRQAQIELARAVASVAERLEAEPHLERGDPARLLAEHARRDVDLLVTGSRGYGPLGRVLLGSVSTALMRSAPCPVMVVPRTAEFEPTAAGMAAEDEVRAVG